MMEHETYFLRTAAAFVRGRRIQGEPIELTDVLRDPLLDELTDDQQLEILRAGINAGLKLHKFKRTMGLARVRRVFGVLHSLSPEDLLDVGSGRGVFLWPLLDEFSMLPVTAVDQNKQRSNDLEAVRLGGIDRLTAFQMDVTELNFDDDQFDVATMLEVLEHIPTAALAVSQAVRVARRFVVLSVPSKPDDNPEHIYLFDEPQIRKLFSEAGVQRLTFEYVLNHIIVVANVSPSK